MTRLDKIKVAAEKYDTAIKQDTSTNDRLRVLVEKYGVEEVSAASGLAVSSLLHYTRRVAPLRASLHSVIKAETVLSKF
jgi:hypothetical protein